MKISHFKFIVAVCLLALTGGFVSAQKEKSKQKILPLEVKANLFVLDAAQKPIDDVKAEGVKIFEDGVEQKIVYFAKKERQANIGLLVDNSGSLRSQFPFVLGAAATIVTNIRPNDEMFILRFISRDKIEVKQQWTADKGLLIKALEQMDIEGGSSAIADAVYLGATEIAKREKADPTKRHALILISDCEDRGSNYKLEQVLALLKNTDVPIYALALISEITNESVGFTKKTERTQAENFARQVAFETNGRAFILKETDAKKRETEILSALQEIFTELRSQYVVGYISINDKRDGRARRLTVEIADGTKGEKRQGYIRESFIVPKSKK